jgi:hypothetical protein
MTLKLGLTPLGRLSKCQVTKDDCVAGRPTRSVLAMTIPSNAPKPRKYNPHSRPQDEMETEENVAGSMLDEGEKITCVP